MASLWRYSQRCAGSAIFTILAGQRAEKMCGSFCIAAVLSDSVCNCCQYDNADSGMLAGASRCSSIQNLCIAEDDQLWNAADRKLEGQDAHLSDVAGLDHARMVHVFGRHLCVDVAWCNTAHLRHKGCQYVANVTTTFNDGTSACSSEGPGSHAIH